MSSQDPIDSYQIMYNLNEKYGYGYQDYDDSHRLMKKITKVPKPKED